MSDIAIKVENLSKYYRLGVINNGTLFKDMQTWFARLRGKEDPNGKIGKVYDDSKEGFWALKDLNFEIKKGDRVGIIGHNGAGKSTLLNLIAGVFSSDCGQIILDGIDVTQQKEHVRAKFLGRVFQDPMMGTAGNMEIEENLAMSYRRGKRRTLDWGIKNSERQLYREKLATLDLGLENRMNAKVGLLSGGQRQALTLLMATLQKPKLLLLDEHTAELDPKTAKKVLRRIPVFSVQFFCQFLVFLHLSEKCRIPQQAPRLRTLHAGRRARSV